MNLIDTGPTPHGFSRVSLVTRCPQLYAWTFMRGVPVVGLDNDEELPAPADGPQPAEPLIRGILIHIFAAHFYAKMRGDAVALPRDALEEAIARFEIKWPDCTGGMRHLVRTACWEFAQNYADDCNRFDVLEVEQRHDYTVTDTGIDGVPRSAPFTVRRDLVLRAKATGLVYLLDHKSTVRIQAKVKRRYILSGQFLSLQHFGQIEYGEQFGGVLYNLIGLTPAPEFARERIEPAPWRLARWPRDYLYAKRLCAVLEATYGQNAEDWPGTDSETQCWTAYGPCPHFETCRWGPTAANSVDSTIQIGVQRAGIGKRPTK